MFESKPGDIPHGWYLITVVYDALKHPGYHQPALLGVQGTVQWLDVHEIYNFQRSLSFPLVVRYRSL